MIAEKKEMKIADIDRLPYEGRNNYDLRPLAVIAEIKARYKNQADAKITPEEMIRDKEINKLGFERLCEDIDSNRIAPIDKRNRA